MAVPLVIVLDEIAAPAGGYVMLPPGTGIIPPRLVTPYLASVREMALTAESAADQIRYMLSYIRSRYGGE